MRIDMIHGNGGKQTSSLINDIFIKYFSNKVLNRLEDSAIVSVKERLRLRPIPLLYHLSFFRVVILVSWQCAGQSMIYPLWVQLRSI